MTDSLPTLEARGVTSTCPVLESRVAFARGPEGEIDVQLPGGKIVRSLPAARFEHVAQHRSKREQIFRRLTFTEHLRS